MYVHVIRFVFHALQYLPIRFAQRNLCYIRKSMMKHTKEKKRKERRTDGRIENWTSLDLVWLSEVRVC